jgi:hypothetical protein
MIEVYDKDTGAWLGTVIARLSPGQPGDERERRA